MTPTPAKGVGHGGPARDYTWPPFEPGNEVAVTHGAYSPEIIGERARELTPHVLEANRHLDPGRDGPAIFRYCELLARIERVYAWLSQQDDPIFRDSAKGKTHGIFERLERWERAAGATEDRLGISPVARSRLGLNEMRAFDLAREWAGKGNGDG